MVASQPDAATDGRLAQALRNARIAFFEVRLPEETAVTRSGSASPTERGAWHWSGADFGITGIAAEAGLQCLVDAAVQADRDGLRRLLDLRESDATLGAEFRIASAGGAMLHLHCEACAEPASSGRPAGLFGVIRDVTYERRFEHVLTDLVRRNHLLLATIDACPLSITVADATQPDMKLIYANRKFLQTSGYDMAEVIGRNCRFLQGPGTAAKAVGQISRAISAGEQTSVELLNYTKTGGSFLNRLVLAPIHDDDGQLTAYIGMQSDATIDARRRDSEAQRQKMEALGRMMGGISHEVNNMLQPIALLGQHMLDSDLAVASGRQHLDVMLECCLKARRIIGDVLAFSRPATRSAEINDSIQLLHDSLRLARPAMPPNVVVSVRICGTPAPVAIESTVFAQIMLNLMTNAAAAMNGRGELHITLEEQVSGARLSVADTGCGMDRLTLDRAFEPFFTTKPVGQGTGLGLPMVYGLIRETGGSISLESEPGRGTTAVILLPGCQGGIGDGGNIGH